MKVKNYSKGADDNQHLLDISSDYNNFSNLSYFISEYKKAKQIIAQCENFYQNFLRNKLYRFDELKSIENINLLNFKVNWEIYLGNCKLIYLFMVNKYLEEQINLKLKTYHFGFYKESIYKSEYWGRDHNNNVWEVRGDADTLLSCVNDCKYWNLLYDIYIFKTWHAHNTSEQIFQPDEIFDDALNLNEVDKNNKKINKFEKTKITRYYKKGFGDEEKIIVCDNPIYVVMFGEEETKLFEIFKEAGEKFYPIYEQIKFHPEEYINEWNELQKFIKDNFKEINSNKNDLIYASGEILRKQEIIKSHKGILFPVDYFIGNKQYVVDAYKFINLDYVKYRVNNKKRYSYSFNKEKNYNLIYENLMHCDLNERSIIKCTELLYYIQTINPDYYKAKDLIFNSKKEEKKDKNLFERDKSNEQLNNPYIVNNPNYYYVLIDNIPYKFTDALYNVKIEYNESDNILTCEYFKNHKYQKWVWPSDSPYTVESYSFVLKFDCATNEPIYYKYNYNTHEEKIR